MAQLVTNTTAAITEQKKGETTMTFAEKIATIQSEVCVPKDSRNDFGKYNYRNAEQILAAVKLCLKRHGLVLTLDDEPVVIGSRYYVKSTATLWDGKESFSKSSYAREAETRKGMEDSQITGSAASYARKYALGGLFAIDDGRDADAKDNRDMGSQHAVPQQQPQVRPAAAPQGEDRAALLKLITSTAQREGIPNAALSMMASRFYGKPRVNDLPPAQFAEFAHNLTSLWAKYNKTDETVPF